MNFLRPQYICAKSLDDFRQIIELQTENLPSNISKEEAKSEGFVTVVHSEELLEQMNQFGGHALAKVDGRVVGYALFMSKELENSISILEPMFEQFKKIPFQNVSLYDCNYFVMGQVCISKEFRGQGIFQGLYDFLKQKNKSKYDFIISEVATKNKRSMRAHEKVGFEILDIYNDMDEEWAVVVWDLKS